MAAIVQSSTPSFLPERHSKFPISKEDMRVFVKHCPFLQMYDVQPRSCISLFDLEGLVMRRMELLAHIDGLRNSPTVNGPVELVERVKSLLKEEMFVAEVQRELGLAPPMKPLSAAELDAGVSVASDDSRHYKFSLEDDLISHLCCRLVFCQSEQWREWFVKNEETVFLARVDSLVKKMPLLRSELFTAAHVPSTPINPAELTKKQMQWISQKASAVNKGKTPDLYSMPMIYAVRAMRNRACLCVDGKAIVTDDSVNETYLGIFKATVHQGLRDAAAMRQRVLLSAGDDNSSEALTNVLRMLDAFFSRFIVDPSDALKPAKEGSVTPAQIPNLAQRHFPPCMRRVEEHLRREHHLKHTGRWTYGLFLKAIGLTLEDAVKLFAQLLTLKAPKEFEKSAYAYNLRHLYGREGKKTSYSSLTCATIINQPPNLDKHDCHGCPFRFKDEGALRSMLAQPRPSIRGDDTTARLSPDDIEDIVTNSRGMHYTKACFKYFTAVHAGAKLQRDTLFRSPYDYYHSSVQLWRAAASRDGAPGDSGTSKRSREEDDLTPQRALRSESAMLREGQTP